jgi:hypothetical protein
MRTLIFATASAIALGIAGAGPLHAQPATTANPAPSAPATEPNAAVAQPTAPQIGTGTEQGMPSAATSGTETQNPAMTGTQMPRMSQTGGGHHGWMHTSRNDVRQIQDRLHADGLYKGRVDGIDGPMTRAAVRDYQQHNGLQVNGRLDQQTMASLLGGSQGSGSPGSSAGYGSTMPTNNTNDMNTPPASNAGETGATSPTGTTNPTTTPR